MKFPFTIGLLGLFALASCEIDEPPVRRPRPTAKYPQQPTTQYPAPPQPFPQDPTQPVPPPITEPTGQSEITSAPAPTAPPTSKGDPPYGVPVPGKPGFVRSPFSPDKMTDVRGYAPGTEVKDPYTGKIFLVP